MKRGAFGKVLPILSVVLVLAVLFWAQGRLGGYAKTFLYLSGIYAIWAVSFNLVYGYTGQFSLGLAGIAAVGAYTMALLTVPPAMKQLTFILAPPVWPISVIHWPFFPALILSGILAAIVGFIIGAPALRVRGNYLVIVTLGFSEIIRMTLTNLPSFCNSSLGIKNIPTDANLVWIWGALILTVFVTKRLVDSAYGRGMKGIRDDEVAAEAMGINLFYHKTLAFVVSAFFIGIGGALYAQILGAIAPDSFHTALTYAAVTIVVLGGVGSITGSVIAALAYTAASELLRAAESPWNILGFHLPATPGLRMLILAVALLVVILRYRKGLLGAKEFSWQWVQSVARSIVKGTRRQGA